jgi:hypothetical protein
MTRVESQRHSKKKKKTISQQISQNHEQIIPSESLQPIKKFAHRMEPKILFRSQKKNIQYSLFWATLIQSTARLLFLEDLF